MSKNSTLQATIRKALESWVSSRSKPVEAKTKLSHVMPGKVKAIAQKVVAEHKPIGEVHAVAEKPSLFQQLASKVSGKVVVKRKMAEGATEKPKIQAVGATKHQPTTFEGPKGYQVKHSYMQGVKTHSGKPLLKISQHQKVTYKDDQGKEVSYMEHQGHPKDVIDHKFAEAHKKLGYTTEDHLHAMAHWNKVGLEQRHRETNVGSIKDPEFKQEVKTRKEAAKELASKLSVTHFDPEKHAAPHQRPIQGTSSLDPHEKHRLASVNPLQREGGFSGTDPNSRIAHRGIDIKEAPEHENKHGEKTGQYSGRQKAMMPKISSSGHKLGQGSWHEGNDPQDVNHVTTRGLSGVIGAGKDTVVLADKPDVGKQNAHSALWHMEQHAHAIKQHHAAAGTLENRGPRTEHKPVRVEGKVKYYEPFGGARPNLSEQHFTQRQKTATQYTRHAEVTSAEKMVNTFKERMRTPTTAEAATEATEHHHGGPGWGTGMKPARHDVDNPLHDNNMGMVHGTHGSGHTQTTEILAGTMPAQKTSKKKKKQQARSERQKKFDESMGSLTTPAEAHETELSHHAAQAEKRRAASAASEKDWLELSFAHMREEAAEMLAKADSPWSKPVSTDLKEITPTHKVGGHASVKYDFHVGGHTESGKPIYNTHVTHTDGDKETSVPTGMHHILHSKTMEHPDLHGKFSAPDHADAMIYHFKKLSYQARVYDHKKTFDKDKWNHSKTHLLAHYDKLSSMGDKEGAGVDYEKPVHLVAKWEHAQKHLFGGEGKAPRFSPKTVKVAVHSAQEKMKPAAIARIKKAMTAGYGYAGAPGAMSGGGVLMTESLNHKTKNVKRCEKCDSDVYHYGDTCLNCAFGKDWMPAEFESFRKKMAKTALKSFIAAQLKKGTFDAHQTISIFEQKMLPAFMKSNQKNFAWTIGQTSTEKPIRVMASLKQLKAGKMVPPGEEIDVRNFDFDKEHAGLSPVDHVESVHFHVSHAMDEHGKMTSNAPGSEAHSAALEARDSHMHHALEHQVRAGDLSNTSGATRRFDTLFDHWYDPENQPKI